MHGHVSQARLEGLVGSLGYAPLAPLPRAAPLHARTLAATVAAVRAAAAAAAAGSLDAAAAERLAWPLLSLARERVRAAPDEAVEQLPRFLAALDGARGWRRRFLASLLPDGLPPPPARAWLALEAAVKTELPPLLAELSSPPPPPRRPRTRQLSCSLSRRATSTRRRSTPRAPQGRAARPRACAALSARRTPSPPHAPPPPRPAHRAVHRVVSAPSAPPSPLRPVCPPTAARRC